MTPKFCVDCRHYTEREYTIPIRGVVLVRRCAKPFGDEPDEVNLVGIISEFTDPERNRADGPCGPEGKLWEAKE